MNRLFMLLLAALLYGGGAAAQDSVACNTCAASRPKHYMLELRREQGQLKLTYRLDHGPAVSVPVDTVHYRPADTAKARLASGLDFNIYAFLDQKHYACDSVGPDSVACLIAYVHSLPGKKLELVAFSAAGGSSGGANGDPAPVWLWVLGGIAIGALVASVVTAFPKLRNSLTRGWKAEKEPTSLPEADAQEAAPDWGAPAMDVNSQYRDGQVKAENKKPAAEAPAAAQQQAAGDGQKKYAALERKHKKLTEEQAALQEETAALKQELDGMKDRYAHAMNELETLRDTYNALLLTSEAEQRELDDHRVREQQDKAYFANVRELLMKPYGDHFNAMAFPADETSRRLLIEYLITMAFHLQSLTRVKLSRAGAVEAANYQYLLSGTPLKSDYTVSSSDEGASASNLVKQIIRLMKEEGSSELKDVLIDGFLIRK